MKEPTVPLGADSQPELTFSSIVFLHVVETPLLEDSFRQLPPYFLAAMLNELQVVDTENKCDENRK